LNDAAAYQVTKVRSVGIVGAGVMGAAIAAAHIRHGVRVVICDANDAVLAKIHDTVATLVADTPGASNFSPSHVRRLVQPTAELAALARCDMIVESIAETLSAKQQLYAKLCPYLGPRTVVATNTSTIPIAQLASGMKDPGRFCGMHFFHPVARRPLVEVVCGPQTSESTVATVVAHVKAIHRQPIIADDGPGFVVNRLLFPFLAEALEMLREGVSVEMIERTATDFGMAMGPLQLMDEIGLDTTLQAGWVLATAFPERILASPLLVTMVKSKQLGCKSGAGFFLYDGSHDSCAQGPHFAMHGQETSASAPRNCVNPALFKRIAQWAVSTPCKQSTPRIIADRLLLPMVLEAARILEEGKALGPAEIDHGSVLGLGFPAWRGGLLQWADTLGSAEIIARLRSLDANAARYQPPAMLTELAEHGGAFYSTNHLGFEKKAS
jgi:3-hydroxyacyl-CoA dehydrogenase/enoyl-CoA hydratase/3-hydroxybutyryl-CoA epimerase/3-hydroxyacyl-CoA dehydrogenase/enoyl-CoA hydratase/3-hydroxybutyryl-CoA epimerase/enoyl-CoA isomerase